MLRIALLISLALQAGAQASLTSKYTNYTEHNYKDVAYGLFKPTNYDPTKSYPLIVYLHGSNDLASRDMLWYQQEMQKQHPAFVITPKCKETNHLCGLGRNRTCILGTGNPYTIHCTTRPKYYPPDSHREYLRNQKFCPKGNRNISF
jgi:hypothetical protein